MRFCCVNDLVPLGTVTALRRACEARDLAFVEVDARTFDFDPARRLAAGDLLYRPATSLAAMRVEQFLYTPSVATFYARPDRIFYTPISSALVLQQAGVPMPPAIHCATTNRDVLRGYVEQLGGFPIVAKMLGQSNGIGVIRVDSWPTLHSLMEYALSQNQNPLLSTYIDPAVHWRVIVVGANAVAAYRNAPQTDGFRSMVTKNLDDYPLAVDPALGALAVRATQALQLAFSGVDILQQPAGPLWVLEANFPCYFLQAQEVRGIDIAGQMVDFLQAKATQLLSAASA